MPHEQGRHVARLDKHELTGMPAQWTEPERGRHLRRLLRDRGIDPDRLYFLSYHPRHRCWLFHQRPPLRMPRFSRQRVLQSAWILIRSDK